MKPTTRAFIAAFARGLADALERQAATPEAPPAPEGKPLLRLGDWIEWEADDGITNSVVEGEVFLIDYNRQVVMARDSTGKESTLPVAEIERALCASCSNRLTVGEARRCNDCNAAPVKP